MSIPNAHHLAPYHQTGLGPPLLERSAIVLHLSRFLDVLDELADVVDPLVRRGELSTKVVTLGDDAIVLEPPLEEIDLTA